MYLIYTTEQEAWNRSEQEGIALGLSYHVNNGIGSRYVTSPQETNNNKWALDVSDYSLTQSEQSATVNSFTPKPVDDIFA